MTNIVLNAKSDGKFMYEKRGGRDFLITKMVPIIGNTVMNDLLYPTHTVLSCYDQLDRLPAPAGHPHFNGEEVSAFDPEGGAAFNVGAFVRNPTLDGEKVISELVIDTEVANRSREGKQIVDRIVNGEKIGVSTGLQANVANVKGVLNDKAYTGVVNEIVFDHVALLLDQKPAGDHTYTINKSTTRHEDYIMREVKFDTSNFSLEDHKMLEQMDAKKIIGMMKKEINMDDAEEVVTNAGKMIVNRSSFEEFQVHKDAIKAFTQQRLNQREENIEFVVKNSKMTRELMNEMTDEMVDALVASTRPKNLHIVNGEYVEPSFEILKGA